MISLNYKINQLRNSSQNQCFYVHSTSQQQSSQKYYRFKTQNKQDSIASVPASFFYTENKERHSSLTKKPYITEIPKKTNTSIQKIHYFELDLKTLITKSCQKDVPVYKSITKQTSKDKGGKHFVKNILNKLDQIQNNKNKVSDINDLSFVLQKTYSKILNNQEQQIENIFPLSQLHNELKKNKAPQKIEQRVNNHNKIKERISTKQQFQLKYKRLNASKRDNKCNKGIYRVYRQNIKSQLQTKCIEKRIIDKNGNQFKVTIEKLN